MWIWKNKICKSNDIIEQLRIFVRDSKEIREKDKNTVDARCKKCRLTIEKLHLSRINRFEYLDETCSIMENLFSVIKNQRD